jgi:hypothetical protein
MQTILENEKKDWLYIIFSPVSGFLLVGFYLLMNTVFLNQPDISLLLTFLVYAVFFDVRHLFSTYSRTYLDKVYFKENKRWLHLTFALIILLPILALLFIGKGEYYWYNNGIVCLFLVRMTTVLGFYHLIKQNWGFMAIYKKKMNEPEDGSDRWEKMMLLSGSFIPLILISILSPAWFPSEQMFLYPEPHLAGYVAEVFREIAFYTLLFAVFLLLVGYGLKSAPQYKYVSRNLGLFFLFTFLLIQILFKWGMDVLYVLLIAVSVVFVLSTVMSAYKALKQKVINTKKWAVLISSLILYNGILLLPIENKLILVMAITIPHNIQYLTFVNFFNRKFYTNSKQEHGLAKRMSQKIGLFLIISFVYAVLYESFRTGSKFLPLGITAEERYVIANFIAVFFLSMSLHHYYLDAIIWRVRKDKEISETV